MIDISKLKVFIITLLIAALFLGASYAIWRHDAEVGFRLTIKMPAGSGGECPPVEYTTIQEGIRVLKNNVYNCMYNKMESYKNQLNARITELKRLPFGGITYDELSSEVDEYRNVDIAGFGTCINRYGTYINDLAAFYNSSTEDEKNEVPDFWDQHDQLWQLSDQLWHKRQELYDVVDALWSVGESKIDYENRSKNGSEDEDLGIDVDINEAGSENEVVSGSESDNESPNLNEDGNGSENRNDNDSEAVKDSGSKDEDPGLNVDINEAGNENEVTNESENDSENLNLNEGENENLNPDAGGNENVYEENLMEKSEAKD